MVYVPFAILMVVLLAGMVTVSLGWKKWHPATIVAAWLLLIAAGGFVVLASMRAEREAAWTELVRRYEAGTRRLVDAVAPGEDGLYKPVGQAELDNLSACSLETLEQSRDAWRRVLEQVDSWRGRSWPNSTFSPPDAENPGLLAIDMPVDPTISEGAILYVFDQLPEDDVPVDGTAEGFVGAFRVEKVEGKEVSIRPLHDNPDNPLLAQDRERWNRPHDLVTVYESLPVDRREFRTRVKRTLVPSADLTVASLPIDGEDAAAEDPDQAGVGSDGPGIPSAPDSDPPPPPDVRWAFVTFDQDYVWKPEDEPEGAPGVAFQANDEFPEFPAREVARLLAEGVKFRYRWQLPPGVYWADVTLAEDWSPPGEKDPDGSPITHPSGSTIRIPLDAAWALEAAGRAKIEDRLRMRPLADGSTILDGIPEVNWGSVLVTLNRDPELRVAIQRSEGKLENADAEGLNRIAVSVGRSIDDLQRLRERLEMADGVAKRRRDDLREIEKTVREELASWQQDSEDADAIREALRLRVEQTDAALRAAESEVSSLAETYRRALRLVATEIGRRGR
jgi:hypothetical protein